MRTFNIKLEEISDDAFNCIKDSLDSNCHENFRILLRDSLWGFEIDKILEARKKIIADYICLLYTYPSPRDITPSRMPSSA